ncbi:hypothetical protein PHMEG_0005752 [Phytophthora megakarya]|uniref:Uncharacterized protein n=1 Tax=Phytophthora megakarya TaxID=4795 RepID=A0A225WQL5_9STRA|nr:hypothetical protein PHMEG_0005752 [Phytophthora megakarya]
MNPTDHFMSDGKYFSPPPPGYTSNYFFEIDHGICTARKNVDTADGDSITFAMIDPINFEPIRKAILGPDIKSIWEASISGVLLPQHPIKSLSAKYFSIPKEYLAYYPNVPEAIVNAATPDSATRKPGRPSKTKTAQKANQPSILQFFSKK